MELLSDHLGFVVIGQGLSATPSSYKYFAFPLIQDAADMRVFNQRLLL